MLSVMDLDSGFHGTSQLRDVGLGEVATLGPSLGVAADFPSWPPSDLSTKVITLTTEVGSDSRAQVACTNVGGSQCAVLDLDPYLHIRLHSLRLSLAAKMELDYHQLQMLLPDGRILDREDDQSMLVEVLDLTL
jgi:hypothetical protein